MVYISNIFYFNVHYLTHIINFCLIKENFLSAWKTENIMSHGLISILPISSKALEKEENIHMRKCLKSQKHAT